MEYIGIGLFAIGGITLVVGAIMLLVAAFSESILWGLGCLFIPLVPLVFICMHWSEAKRPFLIKLAGLGVIFLGGIFFAIGYHAKVQL